MNAIFRSMISVVNATRRYFGIPSFQEISRKVVWDELTVAGSRRQSSPARQSPAEQWRDGVPFSQLAKREWAQPLLNRHAMNHDSLHEMVQKDTFAIPEVSDRQGYFVNDDFGFWVSGLIDFIEVESACATHSVTLRRMLDLGCSSGRVLRHCVQKDDPPTAWGIDINIRELSWAIEHLSPALRLVPGLSIPSTPVPDASVDLVTAFSVFTHVDTLEIPWLVELLRVVNRDGMLYLTVHTEHSWDWLQNNKNSARLRRALSLVASDKEILDCPHLPQERLVFKGGDHYGQGCHVFHSVDYIRKVWGRYAEVVDIRPFASGHQTAVLLKKK